MPKGIHTFANFNKMFIYRNTLKMKDKRHIITA